MGAILIGTGLAVIAAAAALIAGSGAGFTAAAYVAGGILGTLGSAGSAALRVPTQGAEWQRPLLVLRLD